MKKYSKRQKSIRYLALFIVTVMVGFFVSFQSPMAQVYEAALGSGQFMGEKLEIPSLRIEAAIGSALKANHVSGRPLAYRASMQKFYGDHGNQAFWLKQGRSNAHIKTLIQALEKSWTHGLNPEQYHLKRLKELQSDTGFFEKAEFELLLTDAFTRYARDLSGMRVSPAALKLDSEGWRQPLEPDSILTHLASGKNVEDVLDSFVPQSATYEKLREALVKAVREAGGRSEKHDPISFNGELVQPGARHPKIPELRMRLGVNQQTKDPYLYDDALFAAVMNFQRSEGLEADGLIGSNTLHFLNRTKTDKIYQLIANLERLRWAERQLPERFVIVNIPSATLWAINDGRVAMEMPVIVGKKWRRTRSFVTQIEGVRLNPDWTIPPTIKRYDIWPKVKEDPHYLTDKGIELIRGYGSQAVTIDPLAIDWHNLHPSELQTLRMVQVPGEHNPLGRVRVLMPNKYNIYLHDTNKPEYFENLDRAQSSGCIRMKEPEKFAEFVLKTDPAYKRGQMKAILDQGEKTDLEISSPIPVYITYYTVWVDEKNRLVFGNDIYNEDDKLIKHLKEIDGFHIPWHNI